MILPWRSCLSVINISLFLWSIGLVAFSASIPREIRNAEIEADAIVVLTGGAGRLAAGFELLAADRAKKVFISGVPTQVNVLHIIEESHSESITCCVEIGHSADDTYQNALETAAWMEVQGYSSLRLVTGNYHMPRAILEFHRAMPNVIILPNPIFPEHVKVDDWWRFRGTAGLLASEYAKFLLAYSLRLFESEAFRDNPS